MIFPYNSLHSQAVAYTTYFEPGSLSIYMSKSGNLICSCLGSNKSFVLVNGKRLFIYLLKENFKLSFRNIYSSLEWNTIRCRTEWAVTVQHSRLYRIQQTKSTCRLMHNTVVYKKLLYLERSFLSTIFSSYQNSNNTFSSCVGHSENVERIGCLTRRNFTRRCKSSVLQHFLNKIIQKFNLYNRKTTSSRGSYGLL